jgi:hypothetical protein
VLPSCLLVLRSKDASPSFTLHIGGNHLREGLLRSTCLVFHFANSASALSNILKRKGSQGDEFPA